jgi:hypothetical protein
MIANMSFLSPKTEVRPSAIHGRGLFAREAIRRHEVVAIKGGHIFDRQKLRAKNGAGKISRIFLLAPGRKIRAGIHAQEHQGACVVRPAKSLLPHDLRAGKSARQCSISGSFIFFKIFNKPLYLISRSPTIMPR